MYDYVPYCINFYSHDYFYNCPLLFNLYNINISTHNLLSSLKS